MSLIIKLIEACGDCSQGPPNFSASTNSHRTPSSSPAISQSSLNAKSQCPCLLPNYSTWCNLAINTLLLWRNGSRGGLGNRPRSSFIAWGLCVRQIFRRGLGRLSSRGCIGLGYRISRNMWLKLRNRRLRPTPTLWRDWNRLSKIKLNCFQQILKKLSYPKSKWILQSKINCVLLCNWWPVSKNKQISSITLIILTVS